jgi:hypothetical protein
MEPQPNTLSENIRTTPNELSAVEQLAQLLLQYAQGDPTLRNRPPLTGAVELNAAATALSPLPEAVEVPVPTNALSNQA